MPLVRIRRMGDQWSSCGVFFTLPAGVKYPICPKLVPGQVMEVPEGHELLECDLIETVRKPAKDEFIRPMVFRTVEDAVMADPSKSKLGIEAIRQGIALISSAVETAQARRAKTLAVLEDEQDEDEDEDTAELTAAAGRASNTALRSIYDHATPVEDDAPEPPAARGRGRPPRVGR